MAALSMEDAFGGENEEQDPKEAAEGEKEKTEEEKKEENK